MTTTIKASVISARNLDQDLVCSLIDNGTNVTEIRRYEEFLQEFGYQIPTDEKFDTVVEVVNYWDNRFNLALDYAAENDVPEMDDDWFCEEAEIYGVKDGVSYITGWLGGAMLIHIMVSPITGNYAMCSPCVPNTADLDSPCEDGVLAYDVPAEWRYQD